MLDRAHAKYPQVLVKKLGLQDIQDRETFDLIICMDAMEMVFPEDWPQVLANFHRALKPSGQLYFTVEIADKPAIDGEDEGGYHYYPGMDQVRHWVEEAHFSLKEEAESDDYHHFWVQKD
jgi:cyclopropane fatty-acyl-phospholipid synthase-like methyltransferase